MKKNLNPSLKKNYIQQYSLEQHFPNETLEAMQLFTFAKGEFIYHQAEAADFFYLLVEGELQIDYLHSNGKFSILSIGKPAIAIGDLQLFDDHPEVRNVMALEESILLAIEMEKIRETGYDDPRFLRFIIQQITQKLFYSSNRVAQTVLPLEVRLAQFLIYRMESEGSEMKLQNRETLASILGCSVRHLNRTLEIFSRANLIQVDHKSLKVINFPALTETALAPDPDRT